MPSCSPPASLCTRCLSASGGSKARLSLAVCSGPGPGDSAEEALKPATHRQGCGIGQPCYKILHGGESQTGDSSGFNLSAHKHQRHRLAPDRALLGWNGFRRAATGPSLGPAGRLGIRGSTLLPPRSCLGLAQPRERQPSLTSAKSCPHRRRGNKRCSHR